MKPERVNKLSLGEESICNFCVFQQTSMLVPIYCSLAEGDTIINGEALPATKTHPIILWKQDTVDQEPYQDCAAFSVSFTRT